MRALNAELEDASQQLRDPGLTMIGRQMAELYGPTLKARLAAAGFDMGRTVVGASALRRAKETATLLFPGHVVQVMPHLTEHGAIPENTPRAGLGGRKPSWAAFIEYLCETVPGDQDCQLAVVGHGGFLRSEVWGALTGRPKPRMGNLDAFIIEGDLDTATGRLLHRRITEIPYTERIAGPDRCAVAEDHAHVVRHTRKISASSKMKRRSTHRRRVSAHQRGGAATPLPLAYYQPGAFEGRTADATGVGLAGSSATWARAALPAGAQMGGRRSRRKQQGGFTPSVMGSFLTNGMRFVPIAGYMGYKMMERRRPHRRTRRAGRR